MKQVWKNNDFNRQKAIHFALCFSFFFLVESWINFGRPNKFTNLSQSLGRSQAQTSETKSRIRDLGLEFEAHTIETSRSETSKFKAFTSKTLEFRDR